MVHAAGEEGKWDVNELVEGLKAGNFPSLGPSKGVGYTL